MKRQTFLWALILSVSASFVNAEMAARIASFEGTVQVMKKDAADWKNARPGMPLEVGDQVYTQAESFAEIRYAIGTVLRMGEKTKITLESSSEKTVKSKSAIGTVWINMRKLVTAGKEFQVSTPTAVAAIRGTVYTMSTAADSASDVSVYEGKVAVGPSDELKKKLEREKKKAVKTEQPVEVGGPEEIPGPYEVSLDQWRTIVAGQKIVVRSDGKFAQEKFDAKAAAGIAFVKKNLELDKQLTLPREKVK
jgi:hypothetical protein